MDKAYYHISEAQLGEGSKIPLVKMENSEAVFRKLADIMADCIVENNAAGHRTVFICPVGPVGQYPFFVERVNKERISLKKGESKTVTFTIDAELLKFYNSELNFVCEPGEFNVMIGPNSRDVKTASFELK